MDKADILAIQMAKYFGVGAKFLLKERVNDALANGEWHDDFDLAVTPADLTDDDFEKLLSSILRAYPYYVLDVESIQKIIDHHLPQMAGMIQEWLIGPDGDLILTDSFRVAKIQSNKMIWVTQRISWDGIKLFHIKDGYVFGDWYDVTFPEKEWRPLRLSYLDGSIIEGQEVPF